MKKTYGMMITEYRKKKGMTAAGTGAAIGA